ncbi:MAG: M48 family metallopeptidase [Polyangiales bacterium]
MRDDLRDGLPHERAFEGGVFSAALEGGRAGATVSVRGDGVHAVTAEGAAFHLPFAGITLELGGASGRMWFCRSADRSLTIFSENRGFAPALASLARRELGPAIDAITTTQRAGSRSRLWIVLGCVAAVALLGLAVVRGVRGAGSAAIDLVPRAVDVQLGKLASEHLPAEGTPVDDPVVTAAVRAVVDRLAQHAPHDFKLEVRVLDGPTVNAFALPGGFIVVYTGLLRVTERPEQLAGVLAHEIAHVTERHGMRRIAQSVGVVALVQLLFGDVSGIAAIAVELLREGAINSYSREQESEADHDGVQTMARAGLDPRALAEFFAILRKQQHDLPSALSWLGTHPDLGARIARVNAEADTLKVAPAPPLAVDWAELSRRVAPRTAP